MKAFSSASLVPAMVFLLCLAPLCFAATAPTVTPTPPSTAFPETAMVSDRGITLGTGIDENTAYSAIAAGAVIGAFLFFMVRKSGW